MAAPCYLCTNLPPGSDAVGLSSYLVDPGAEPVDARMRREEDRVRRRQQDQHADTAYNMANGQLTSDVVDASEQLLVRDFPEVARISPTDGRLGKTGQHFVPNTFLSEAQEVVEPTIFQQKKAAIASVPTTLKQLGMKDKTDKLKGEAPERRVVEELKAHFTSTGPDGGSCEEMALVHGAKLILATQALGQLEGFEEKDIVLINKTFQYVMQIEAKQSLSDKKKKVLQQLNLKKFIDSFFSAEMTNGWTNVSVVYTESLAGVTACSDCSDFTMVGRADVVPKLRRMVARLTRERPSPTLAPMVYRTLLRSILFSLSANPGPVVKSKMTEEVFQRITSEQGTATNIRFWSFWTPSQLGLMASNLRFVVMDSSMSTGKTELLVGKATELSRRGENVLLVVVNFVCPKKTLLQMALEKRLRKEKNVEVLFINISLDKYKVFVKDTIGQLLLLATQHPLHHLLVDELLLPFSSHHIQLGREVEGLRRHMEGGSTSTICWVVVAGINQGKDEDFTANKMAVAFPGFYRPDLRFPLRGSRAVVDMAGNHKTVVVTGSTNSRLDLITPSNLVPGIPPTTIKVRQGDWAKGLEEAMRVVAREEGARGVAVLITHNSGSDRVAVKAGILKAGRKMPLQYMGRTSDSSEAEVARWIEGDNGRPDLLARHYTCRGWEERVIVVVANGSDSKENLLLRTIARLVVVE